MSCRLSRQSTGQKPCDAKLLGASQAPQSRAFAIARHDARKACQLNELHDQSNQGHADIHRKPPRSLSLGNYKGMGKRVSNRQQKN